MAEDPANRKGEDWHQLLQVAPPQALGADTVFPLDRKYSVILFLVEVVRCNPTISVTISGSATSDPVQRKGGECVRALLQGGEPMAMTALRTLATTSGRERCESK